MMSLIRWWLGQRNNTAELARERLQIILAHERSSGSSAPAYLSELKEEILQVVAKYVAINRQDIKVRLEREGEYEVLELNIPLPEESNVATIRATTQIRNPPKISQG